ncbi:Methyltransferase-like protein 5 [Neolecta irregularis DAH-3]|uniref:Methyltransferase-like protein 5 n=1 Tax=Neolecta irregularis (strain DAH-3) TaxID=1198029 RepID=A0A1U7LHF5_NEOID|nr:Methyltransferase-like protein 5 [Neolecta irregularis DAH-3]|eukprot:OLL22090.1 Methyltransferase-like protein 5 [Neolecta irregularis DAH-3]
MLFTAHSSFDDIKGKIVADLGCGIAASFLEAGHVIGFDIDSSALDIARENIAEAECENVDLVLADLADFENVPARLCRIADTVVMNPPFGTRLKGIDMLFLKIACQMSRRAVYSLHKTSTREYVVGKVKGWGWDVEVIAEMKFDIKAMYKFHKKKSMDIGVDLIRLSHGM